MKRSKRRVIRRIGWLMICSFVAGYLWTGGPGQIIDWLEVPEIADKLTSTNNKETSVAAEKPRRAIVSSAVDGDTIKVTFGTGAESSVRLIGIDTPESNRPGVPVECGARQAAAFTSRVAQGHRVKLTVDRSQDRIDRYGRLLRYAKIDGKDLGRQVIAAGWGAPYVYDQSHLPKHITTYRKAAAAAKSDQQGAWRLCDGNFHSEAEHPWSGD